MNRRTFLARTAATTAIATTVAATSGLASIAKPCQEITTTGRATPANPADPILFVPNRIAVSTYSFFTFRDGSKLTMPECIDTAARMGFDGVELLLVQMEDTSDGFLQKLKP